MQWRWRRAHLGHQHLRQHLLLVLLAQKVGDDPRHALRQAHLLDGGVLDAAAQRDARDELVEADRLGALAPRLLPLLATLRDDEGILHVHRGERHVEVDRRRADHARDRGDRRVHHEPLLRG